MGNAWKNSLLNVFVAVLDQIFYLLIKSLEAMRILDNSRIISTKVAFCMEIYSYCSCSASRSDIPLLLVFSWARPPPYLNWFVHQYYPNSKFCLCLTKFWLEKGNSMKKVLGSPPSHSPMQNM